MKGYGWCKSTKKCTHDSPEVFKGDPLEDGCTGGATDFIGFASNNNQALLCPGISEAEKKEETGRLEPGDLEADHTGGDDGKPEDAKEGNGGTR